MLARPLALLMLVLMAATAQAAPQPNVLFLISDDQRADAIGVVNPQVRTPHIDELAQRGFMFRNAFCMGATQGAVCVSSRAMLLSGRSLYHVESNLDDVTTLPRRFGDAGYATTGIGKWHNGAASYLASFKSGGPVFFGGMGNQFKLAVSDFDPAAQPPLTRRQASGTHAATLFADGAIDFLHARKENQPPFFLYVSFTVPHDPRTAPPEFAGRYDPATLDLPTNFLPDHPFDNGEMQVRDELLEARPRTPQAIRRHLADYYDSITHLDHEVGRILAALDASGEADNTIIVYTSDHGLAIGSHGLMGKQNLYDHSLRAPLILAGPGIPQGQSDALVYLYDLYPTLCALAGVEPADPMDGISLTPLLGGTQQSVRAAALFAYRDVQRAVRTPDWKLIVYPQIERVQLFNLATDPDERHDLSADPQHRQRLAELAQELTRLQRQADDPLTLTLPLFQ